MAQLTDEPYPLPERDDYDDFHEHHEAEQAAMDELRDDPDETLVKWPQADGYAHYRVVQWDPLVLQHVPFGDGYRLPAAHIRGLREQDVRNKVRTDRKLAEMFDG